MKLFFKKLFTAPLYILSGFAGMFGFGMLLEPLNLPFLLKFSEDVMFGLYVFLGVLFASIVAAIVRTQHLRSSDLFEQNPEKSLLVRVITSREYLTELCVFVLLAVGYSVGNGIAYGTPFWQAAGVTAMLTVGGGLLFAAIDCLIWIISYKRIRR